MSAHCCEPTNKEATNDPIFRRVLWFALVVNASMFFIEFFASEVGDSVSLKADALDFFADSANYAISLFVVGATLSARAKASLIKAASMLALGVFVVASATWRAVYGSYPEATVMSTIGVLALFANVIVAIALFKYRSGDSNMRSIWLCSRNDAIGNIAVIAAGIAVFFTASRWPDLIVALIIASLAITSALQIIKLARKELSSDPSH